MMLRDRDCEGPWVPGLDVRFSFPDKLDYDEAMVREQVQDGGAHLFVLHLPSSIGGSTAKVLAEAYYPDEMQSGMWNEIGPRQRADWQDGRLVVVSTLPLRGTQVLGDGFGSVNVYFGPLKSEMLDEVRRNNRSARLELKRTSSAHARKLELRNHQEETEERLIEESGFCDFYVERALDTRRVIKDNPFVSQYGGGAR